MNKNKEEEEPKPSNDIKDLRSFKQLSRLELNYDSPRLQKACFNLGVTVEELKIKDKESFEDKRVSKDVVDLRYKVCLYCPIITYTSILFTFERSNINVASITF